MVPLTRRLTGPGLRQEWIEEHRYNTPHPSNGALCCLSQHSTATTKCLFLSPGFYLLVSVSVSPLQDERTSRPTTHGRFTYWQYPTPVAVPCGLISGPDDAIYVQGLLSNSIARLDPGSMRVTDEYFIPFTTAPLGNASLPTLPGIAKPFISCALVNGCDGYIYASNGIRNQLVRLDVKFKQVVIFTAPDILGNLQPLNDITAAPDGICFTQTTGNSITHFDYVTHKFTTTKVPTLLSSPLGIYYASDGGIWFLGTASQKYGRLDRGTKSIVEYPLPEALFGPLTMRAETRRAAQGSKYIWFTGGIGGSIGRIDITDGSVKAFKIDVLGVTVPIELCPATGDASSLPKNWAPGESDIYFTHEALASLGKLNSSTGAVPEIPFPDNLLPSSPVSPFEVFGTGIWCNPGRFVWYTEAPSNRIVRYRR